MVRGFSTKKIKSKQATLGEVLKGARISKKISISDAEIATKVRAKFLNAIENAEWHHLPQSVYVRGFILAYAKYLELPLPEIMSIYEKESKACCKEDATKISYDQSLKQKKVLITPKVLAYCALGVFVVTMCTYIVMQVLNFAGTPNLKVTSPDNNSIVETDSVDLSGVTDTDTAVSINSENVPVSNEGKFLLTLRLHPGVNVIKVRAVNKAKKESSEVYTIEYKPKTAAIPNESTQ